VTSPSSPQASKNFSQPMLRVTSITLNGADKAARTQLLNRDIADTIRVRRRGDTTQPIDIVTRILAQKRIDVHGNLTAYLDPRPRVPRHRPGLAPRAATALG
jgi:hypothetical protein